MSRRVWPFGFVTIVAGVGVGLVAVGSAPPAWLALPSHGLLSGPATRAHAVLLAVLLVALGWGLAHRRAVALAGTVVVLGLVGLDLRSVGYTLGFLVAAGCLALWYGRWTNVPDHRRLSIGVRNGLVTAVAAVGYGGIAHFHVVPGLDVGSAALVVVLVGLGSALRAAPAPAASSEPERSLVHGMVDRPDADTLAPFALRSDKTYLFSADGAAAVGYRVLLGVAVVGGDPVGDPAAYPDVVARFLELCARKGWRPAVLGARGDLVGLWSAHGLRSVGIGAEVVLDVTSFGLATRTMRNVRQAVRRTHNAGVRTTVLRAGDVPVELRAEMAALSREWFGSNRERGFSMILDGLFDESHPEALFVLAFDPADRLVGFQRYLPAGDSALSLDVMRRTKDRLNGLNERMIVDVVDHARRTGPTRVSLNFAAFRELLDRPAAGRSVPERVGYRLLHLLDPLLQVESLYLFNAKFRPGYVPRSVVLGTWLALPVVLLAMLGLEFALPYDRHRVARSDDADDSCIVVSTN